MKMQSFIFCYGKRITVFLVSAAFLVVFLSLQPGAAQAVQAGMPGSLDSTFGNGGIVTTDFGGSASGFASAIQADGKIVVAGSNGNFALARYNSNGSLDASFGSGGKAITSMGSGGSGVKSIAIQSDGKIVAVGSARVDAGIPYFALARYNSNGSLDTTFDFDGKVLTRIGTYGDVNPYSEDIAYSVAILPDGKIIVAGGYGGEGASCAIARYNADGSLDTSFGSDGIVKPDTDRAHSIAIQPDGKIVALVSGMVEYSFRIARFNTDGSLDASFNGNGEVSTNLGFAYSIAIQRDGKIVAAGYSYGNGNNDFALVRYNTNGSLDRSFDGDGIVTTPTNSDNEAAHSVAIQPDGKIVAAGQSGNYPSSNFALARYNTDGSLDISFDGDGIVTTSIGNGNSGATAVALQPDGKVVAAGYSNNEFAVVRYNASKAKTLFDFDGDSKADISVFRPSDSVWYLNRSTQGFSAAKFGLSTDQLAPADYDGDGKTDIAVFRNGMWYWLNSSNGSFNAFQFGSAGDIPVPADYTGDRKGELAVYSYGTWWTLNLTDNQVNAVQFGIFLGLNTPIVADYDGDGRADYAVYNNGIWYLLQSTTQDFSSIQFGLSTDKPVPSDYDGDGKTDIAVYRNGIWYILRSSQGFTAFQWGISTDIPAPADYDGDGLADAAVYRNGIWCLLQSTNGVSIQQFGLPNDKPVAANYPGNSLFVVD